VNVQMKVYIYTQNIHCSSARSHASRVAPGIAAEVAGVNGVYII
jgi:hypothetical protein